MTPPLGHGVIVLGMHRSGTSAVTGVIDSLGVHACRGEDRFPTFRANPRGNFESRSLSFFDELLLRELGGRWWAPVLPSPGWAAGVDGEVLQQAADLFAAAHPIAPWVWKDPRACMLLGFWDRVLGVGRPRIIVLRPPLEIAASLAARDQMPEEQALALTERYLRTALRESAGAPAMLTRYADLLADPSAWCYRCSEFLAAHGIEVTQPLRLDAAQAFLSDDLRHHTDPADEMATSAVWRWADEHAGSHNSLSTAGLPEESAATAVVLARALTSGRQRIAGR